MSELRSKNCIPCQGGVPPLPIDERKRLLSEIHSDWSLISDNNHLQRRIEFEDFITAFEKAGRIASLAEEEWHHPDIKVGWGYLEIEVWTHKIGSLVESDFILASKIDEILED